MKCRLEIRRNSDGKVVICPDEDWDEANEFMWSEGNYSCDCNRSLFFHRAEGTPDDAGPCGNDRYSVRLTDTITGVVVYQDGDWLEATP